MKSLRTAVIRAALWALVAVLVLSAILPLTTAASGTTTYTLYGYVHQPNPKSPVPAGVTVDLISSGTGQTYTTKTALGGQFVFSSSTNAPSLVPGTWGVWVPVQTNVTLSGCGPYSCAILPSTTIPQYSFQSSTNLTNGGTSPVTISSVTVLQYNATISGTVNYTGAAARAATVELLDPSYNNAVLVANVTNSRGAYTMEAPNGTWVLETIYPGPTTRYNVSQITVPSFASLTRNIVIQNYLLQGFLESGSPAAPVTTTGSVTVYDPTNGYIYSSSTPAGGFYSVGTYRNFTTGGPQTLDVFLSSVNYTMAWFTVTVSSGTTITKDVLTTPAPKAVRANYTTTLNFAGFNVNTGKATLTVTTNASLGNNTVFPTLGNSSIGQLWAQLGLDFAHSTSLPSSDVSAVIAFLNSTGAFFPAVQAGTTINGTAFVPSSTTSIGQPIYTLKSSVAPTASSYGPSSTSTLTLNYSESFKLNGTVVAKSSAYTLSFSVLHPQWFGTYTYRVVLPAGFTLQAGTTAPSATTYTPAGPGGTWTTFNITTYPSSSPYSTLTLPIIKYGGVTPILNVTGSNFAFSSASVLNSSRGNYTVVLGAEENASFAATNTIYATGTNGSFFSWNFGNGVYNNTTSPVSLYEYPTADVTTTTPWHGTLTVLSSGGLRNTTNFTVWVAPPNDVKAVITSNASASQTKTTPGGLTYLMVNSSTQLYFNATASIANVTYPTVPGVFSIALWSATSTTFSQKANYSTSQNAYFGTNFTVLFSGSGARYINATVLNGTTITFLGWEYWVNLTVWDGSGYGNTTGLIVLVVDAQKPVAAFSILGAGGKYITSGVVTAGSGTASRATIYLRGANASDPNNGSIVKFFWNITNSGNSSVHITFTQTSAGPSFKYPGNVLVNNLTPQSSPDTINLTVTDRNGNTQYTTQSLTVATNSTTTALMSASVFTGPTSTTVGSSYTYWLNITTGGGSSAVAKNITVSFYLITPGGTTRNYIVPSSSVKFYNYTSSGVVNTTVVATGVYPSLAYNKTIRAEITWSPGPIGSWNLYANVTSPSAFPTYSSSGLAVLGISVSQNPTTLLIEYGIIAAVAVAVILLLVILYRRRRGRARPAAGRMGLERGVKKPTKDDTPTT